MKRYKFPILLAAFCLAGTAVFAAEATGSHGEAVSMTHRMMMLMLQLGTIIFAARLGGMLFERIKLPSVLGELFAGIIIGPQLLGGIPLPGFAEGLFHLPASMVVDTFTVSPELYGLATLASVVLLFLVGLETDIKLFIRYSVAGSLVGVGGVLVSFIFGNLLTVALSPYFFGEQLGPMAAPCIFLGIISTATSVGITARVLSERNKLESPEGVTILAGAVVDDVLGIILLAIGMGVISSMAGDAGVDWGSIGKIAAKAIGIWLAATVAGLVFAYRIGALLKTFRQRSTIAVMALGLAILLAGLFEEVKLAMIIGAYVMGLSLSRTDLSQMIQEKLHVLHILLVPIFFAVMGMLVDVSLLKSPKVLILGLLFSIAATLAKLIGCGIPAFFSGFNLRGSLRIGAGMLPRGEVTLIIAGTGLAAGILTPEVFGVVIFMVFFAAIIAPPAIVASFRSSASGIRKAIGKEEEGVQLSFDFPTHQAAVMLVGRLTTAFEAEGFFVHTLNRRDAIYQLRKDDIVLGFRLTKTSIQFDCPQHQVAFINTAMVEVVADLERTIRDLRKPLDTDDLKRRLQDESGPAASSTCLAAFISSDLLTAHLQGSTSEEVIRELLQLMQAKGYVEDLEAAYRDVLSREESLPTGLQYGIAIPHARTTTVNKLVCAVGLRPEGVDFHAVDGRPSRIIVLTLSPQGVSSPHMHFMSLISQALTEQGRTNLLSCDTESDMFAMLSGQLSAPVARTTGASAMMGLVGLRKPRRPELVDYLDKRLLIPHLTATTKEGIIDEMLAQMVKQGLLQNLDQARQAVLEREVQMSTGMECGIAIPHARTDAVDHILCAVGVHASGIDFDSLDGLPSRIFVMILTPTAAAAPHMQLMALLTKTLDAEGRERVCTADTQDELWLALINQVG